jgi:hypothetical protein
MKQKGTITGGSGRALFAGLFFVLLLCLFHKAPHFFKASQSQSIAGSQFNKQHPAVAPSAMSFIVHPATSLLLSKDLATQPAKQVLLHKNGKIRSRITTIQSEGVCIRPLIFPGYLLYPVHPDNEDPDSLS